MINHYYPLLTLTLSMISPWFHHYYTDYSLLHGFITIHYDFSMVNGYHGECYCYPLLTLILSVILPFCIMVNHLSRKNSQKNYWLTIEPFYLRIKFTKLTILKHHHPPSTPPTPRKPGPQLSQAVWSRPCAPPISGTKRCTWRNREWAWRLAAAPAGYDRCWPRVGMVGVGG